MIGSIIYTVLRIISIVLFIGMVAIGTSAFTPDIRIVITIISVVLTSMLSIAAVTAGDLMVVEVSIAAEVSVVAWVCVTALITVVAALVVCATDVCVLHAQPVITVVA